MTSPMTFRSRVARDTTAVLLAACVAQPVFAQGARLDRTKRPVAGPAPVTRIPTWTRTKLEIGRAHV